MNNLFPNPDLTVNGPYALCSKCHDLQQVLTNTSFSEHAATSTTDFRVRPVIQRTVWVRRAETHLENGWLVLT